MIGIVVVAAVGCVMACFANWRIDRRDKNTRGMQDDIEALYARDARRRKELDRLREKTATIARGVTLELLEVRDERIVSLSELVVELHREISEIALELDVSRRRGSSEPDA